MAIKNRQGKSQDFVPTKLVSGEFAVVQEGDENTADGSALYLATKAGSVKRIPFATEVEDLKTQVDDVVDDAREAIKSAIDPTLKQSGKAADAKVAGDQIADLKKGVKEAKDDIANSIDPTLTQSGKAADAKKTGDEIADLKSDLTQTEAEIIETAGVIEELECELTDEVKAALLACFTRVAWIDDDGQTYYNALSEALNRSRVISSISAVFSQGSAVIYDTDEIYALKQYLTVTATYSDGTTKEVNNYTLNGKLVAGTSTITVAYNKKTTTFNVTVTHQEKTLESISATFNSSASITTDNVLDDLRPYLTVRASYSDGSTNTITNYTLSGSLNVGTNTITVTYNNKAATFTVNVTQEEKTLQSIAAVFNQGSAVIYTDSSLNDLKPYLTVTANYSDSTTQTVTGYTLSGTLTKGISTITVSYGGKTATFTVNVTQAEKTLIYSLPQTTTFNGTSDYIDTGIQLAKDNTPFTIQYDIMDQLPQGSAVYSQTTLYHCMHETDPYPGYSHVIQRDSVDNKSLGFSFNGTTANYDNVINYNSYSANKRIRTVITKKSDGTISIKSKEENGTIQAITTTMPEFVSVSETLLIGAYRTVGDVKGRFWKGIMYDFKIYNHAISDDEANAYLQAKTPIYSLPQRTTFDGTSSYIDTEVQLGKENIPFTIAYDITDQMPSTVGTYEQTTFYHCMHEVDPYPGYSHVIQRDNVGNKNLGFSFNGTTANYDNYINYSGYASVKRIHTVITKDATGLITIKSKEDNGTVQRISTNMPEFVSVSETLLIGAYRNTSDVKGRFWKGIVHDFKVYDYAFSDSEANAYLEEDHS